MPYGRYRDNAHNPPRMKRSLKILLSATVWVAIAAYLVWADTLGKRQHAYTFVKELRITVRDSMEIGIVHASDVRRWIDGAGLAPEGLHLDSVHLADISATVASHDFVRHVRTYAGLDGIAHVEVVQRRPLLRIITDNGYNFYYTADNHIVPAGNHSAHYVPVITGRFSLPFTTSFNGPLTNDHTEKKSQESYAFLYKLINFVKYIEAHDFWNAQIVQINVLPGREAGMEPDVEIIPRVGDHVVMLGQLDGYEDKLDKLLAFYRKAMPAEGWDRWDYIDLKFDGQVVCGKR